MEDNLSILLSGDGEYRPEQPKLLALVPEPVCNLACEHCFYLHDIAQVSRSALEFWGKHLNEVSCWDGAMVVYAGRILTERGAKVIKLLHGTSYKSGGNGNRFGIIDNGYHVTKFPELFPLYDFVDISIDGVEADHDKQRRRPGAFRTAIATVRALKKEGLDVAVSSVISPFNSARYAEFEKFLADLGIPLSCTPVLPFEATLSRGMPMLEGRALVKMFSGLLAGGEKIVRLLSREHIKVLLPVLKDLDWESYQGLYLSALAGEVTVNIRPCSLILLEERILSWDGWNTDNVDLIGRESWSEEKILSEANLERVKDQEILGNLKISPS